MDTRSLLSLRLHTLYYNLGCVLHQQGKLVAAADSYYQAIAFYQSQIKGNQANVPKHLAIIPDRSKQINPLYRHHQVSAHTQVCAVDPTKAYNNLGCLLVQQGRWQEAIQVYRQAIELYPDQGVLYSNLGRALFKQDPAEAVIAYRRAIELQPDLVLAHHNLGLVLQHQNQHMAAIECFQRTLQLEPAHPTAHSDCAASWLALGKIKPMLLSLRESILPHAVLIRAYCDLTDSFTGTDSLTLAKVSCGRFLRALLQQADQPVLNQHLTQTYLHWANVLTIYGGNEQLKRAETYYQRALQLQPHSTELFLQMAECLMRQGRSNAAILTCYAALTSCPSSSQNYLQLGYAFEQYQCFQMAIECYQKALEPQTAAKQSWSDQSSQSSKATGVMASAGTPLAIAQATESSSQCLTNVKRANAENAVVHQPQLQGFYTTTLDWMAAHELTDSHYIPVVIGDQPTSSPELGCATTRQTDIDHSIDHNAACAGLNCVSCLKQIQDWFSPIHLGDGLHVCSGQKSGYADPPPPFVAIIPQGRAWAVPQQSAWMVCNAIAVLTPDDYLLADLARAYPGELPGCQNTNPERHPVFAQSSLPPLKTIEGTVAVLSSLSGNTYFHWIVDVLPRIEILRRSGLNLDEIDWFLINGGNHSFQYETLNKLGISKEKILSSDQHSYVQSARLIAPAFSGYFGWLEPWALSFLRQEFLSIIPNRVFSESSCSSSGLLNFDVNNSYINSSERVYISRSDANHRQLLNEVEIFDHLRPLGFVQVALESLSFRDQVALFASAKVIIAPHGSGLTNMVFCQPGTTVIELVSPHYVRHYYWVISHLLGLNHYFLSGETLPSPLIRELMYQNPLIEDIWINIKSLKMMLERLNLS